MSWAKVAWFVLALTGVAFTQQGTISGVVIEPNGDPVRKAIVTLTLQGTPRKWARQRTDRTGQFRFEGLPAGKYELSAAKSGEGSAVYGAMSSREHGEVITFDDGATLADLKLRFIRLATISGRVLDAEGDPVVNANVALARAGRNLGERVMVQTHNAFTDDRGEYRMADIEPGQYYLRPSALSDGAPMGGRRMLGSRFYGGSTDFKDATPIKVQSGQHLMGFNMQLNEIPVVAVSGHVTGIPTALPPHPAPTPGNSGDIMQTVEVTITPVVEAAGLANTIALSAVAGAEQIGGAFEFPAVPAGQYVLRASTTNIQPPSSVSRTINVQPGMGEVLLELAPSVTLNGLLTIEGGGKLKPSSLQVNLLAAAETLPGRIDENGKFSISNVTPGEWNWNLSLTFRDGYVKSARLGNKDVRYSRIAIEPVASALFNIVVSTRTASIEGEVPRRAGILLAPTGALHNLARFYYSVESNPEGKFTMIGIAPGKYRLYALEGMMANAFRSPEAADQLGDLGEEIEVAEGQKITVHPKPIAAERARQALP